MKASTQDILAAVIRSLGEDVTPFLERESWVASSVRSCVQLLTHLQDRIPHERSILTEGNRLMAEMLRETQRHDAAWARGLDAEIEAALATASLAPDVELVQLSAANQALKELLTDVVHRFAEARAVSPSAGDGAFRTKLQSCLSAVNEKEQKLFERARQRVPI